MLITYREYKKEDYPCCEALVNTAWGFDNLFNSEGLRSVAKYLYTKGSLVSSNYKVVAVHENTVIGFIFGYNPSSKKEFLSPIGLGLKATFDLNFRKMDKTEKSNFIESLKGHQVNRSKLALNKSNEIVLFVVSPQFQGQGIGTKLWLSFKDFCLESSSKSILVETNKLGASSFYEGLGFRHYADFDSPLHNLASKDGQACIYEYVETKS